MGDNTQDNTLDNQQSNALDNQQPNGLDNQQLNGLDNQQSNKVDIPDELHFYFYLTPHSLYILTQKRLDFLHIYKSIQLSWLQDILEDVNHLEHIDWQSIQGGLQDLGDFQEGNCFKLSSQIQPLDYTLCADRVDQKQDWMDSLYQVMHKGVQQQQGGGVEQKGEYELPKAFQVDQQQGQGQSKHSEWVVIHGWTQCSVKCGGGFTYQQRLCVKGQLNQPCLGDEVLQRTCNMQPCTPPTLPPRLLKPVVKQVTTSDRLQSYTPCVLKEGDLYLKLQIANLQEQPKVPVRVVINNHTLTIFANKYYESLYSSFDLQYLQVAPQPSTPCFTVSDTRQNKQQTLCIMPNNLPKGNTLQQEEREWRRVIQEFQFKCSQLQNNVPDSPLVAKLKQTLSKEYMQDRSKVQEDTNDQKECANNKAKSIIADLVKEIKYQNSAIKEQIEKQKMMKEYIENQLGKASESKSDCDKPNEVGNKLSKDQDDSYEYGPESLYQEVLGNIDQNSKDQLNEFKIVGLKHLSRLKKINQRKLKLEQNQITLFKQEKATQLFLNDRKGNAQLCLPSTAPPQRSAFCEDKVKKYNIYKYIDCVYGSPADYCYSCCETEFGSAYQGLRNKCYLQCQPQKDVLTNNVGAGQEDRNQTCEQKVEEHKSIQGELKQIFS